MLRLYVESVNLRRELLDLLRREGVGAVDDRVETENEVRRVRAAVRNHAVPVALRILEGCLGQFEHEIRRDKGPYEKSAGPFCRIGEALVERLEPQYVYIQERVLPVCGNEDLRAGFGCLQAYRKQFRGLVQKFRQLSSSSPEVAARGHEALVGEIRILRLRVALTLGTLGERGPEILGDDGGKLLESFRGFVEEVEGDTAYVSLMNLLGEKLHGRLHLSLLSERGIGERCPFICRTIEQDDSIGVEVRPLSDQDSCFAQASDDVECIEGESAGRDGMA